MLKNTSSSVNKGLINLVGIALIIAVAGYFRMGIITDTFVKTPVRADAYDYYTYAYNLKYLKIYSRMTAGQEMPVADAIRPPGYPAFLVPFIKPPPYAKMLLKINLAQAILGVLTVVLAWRIYLNLMPSGFAWVAAILTAMSPHLISLTTYLISETLFTFLLILSVWIFTVAHQKGNVIFYILTGAVIGACALTKPTLNYFVFLAAVFIFYQNGSRNYLKPPLALLFGFLLVFSPWIVRNINAIGAPLDSTLMIATMHHGLYPGFMYKDMIESKGVPYRFDPMSREISSSFETVFDEIERRFRSEPFKHLKWFLVDKTRTFFSWDIINGAGDIFVFPVAKSPYLDNGIYKDTRALMVVIHPIIIILALSISILIWVPRIAIAVPANSLFTARLLSLLIIYFCLVHIIGAPFPRYSVPLRPITNGMGLFALFVIYRRFSAGLKKSIGLNRSVGDE